MQDSKPGSDAAPCPSCGGELERGLSECPRCGEMAPLNISANPVALVKRLAGILAVIAVGLVVKLLLLG